MGVTESLVFQPVCDSGDHAKALLELLENSTATQDTIAMTAIEEERLEAIHYQTWISCRADHIESVTQSGKVRKASLKASHQARVALLEEQIVQATDARIRRMKESQLEAANRDFERRSQELERVSGQAEIVAEVAVVGVLVVENQSGNFKK